MFNGLTMLNISVVPCYLLEDETEVGEDDPVVHVLSQLQPLQHNITRSIVYIKCKRISALN